jgi:REP element-mobilizing transposase RayT
MVWLVLPIMTLIHYLFSRSIYHGSRAGFIFLFLAAYIVLGARFPGEHPAFQSWGLVLLISIKLYAMILLWVLVSVAIRNVKRDPCSVAAVARGDQASVRLRRMATDNHSKNQRRDGNHDATDQINNPNPRSVASPEATNNSLNNPHTKKYSPPYKTWGQSRSLRLRDFDYCSPYIIYHITIGSTDRKTLFVKPGLNRTVIETLKKSAPLYGYRLIAYSLLPDHLHILVQAEENPKDLRNFVRAFKSYSTKETARKLWQRGFYEHILRKEEKTIEVAEYILNNPVRKGLVEKMEDYPWSEFVLNQK